MGLLELFRWPYFCSTSFFFTKKCNCNFLIYFLKYFARSWSFEKIFHCSCYFYNALDRMPLTPASMFLVILLSSLFEANFLIHFLLSYFSITLSPLSPSLSLPSYYPSLSFTLSPSLYVSLYCNIVLSQYLFLTFFSFFILSWTFFVDVHIYVTTSVYLF